jgi:DNA-binding MarR family transcriptional regulator
VIEGGQGGLEAGALGADDAVGRDAGTGQDDAVEDVLKPYALTFAAYEALRLLAFSRSGSLPMGKMGVRLMVHPAAVTNAIARLEQRGLVRRQMSPEDRRVVLATITPAGRTLAEEATDALNQAAFGLPGLSQEQAAQVTAMLHLIRASTGDV